MQVETVKKVTLTEQIMDQIAGKIISGELQPGEKLPNERDFSEMFGVTRSSVREALRALSLIGMIDIKPSGGSFVADGNRGMPEETVIWMYHQELNNVDDIYAARRLIETAVYLECYANRDEDVIKLLYEYRDKMAALYKKRVTAEIFLDCLDELDLYVAKMSLNSIYLKLMQTIILLRRESAIKILKVKGSKSSAVQQRTKIINSFAEDDVQGLRESLRDFFDQSVKNLHMEH